MLWLTDIITRTITMRRFATPSSCDQ